MPLPKQQTLLDNGLIIVGNKTYNKNEVFESSGHFREDFYKEEIYKFYNLYSTRQEFLSIYKQFKKRYPTLDEWFQDDLISRVGYGDSNVSHETRLQYRSRRYIYYLSLFGLPLDYPYLFSIRATYFPKICKRYNSNFGFQEVEHILKDLSYGHYAFSDVRWVFYRLIMHTNKKHYSEITIEDLQKFEAAADNYLLEGNRLKFWPHVARPNISTVKSSVYRLHVAFYALETTSIVPTRHYTRQDIIKRDLSDLKQKSIADTILRYTRQIGLTKEKSTIDRAFTTLYHFALWLEVHYPSINNLNKLSREIIDHYLQHLQTFVSSRTGRKYSVNQLSCAISTLKVFFDESLYFGYQDVPQRKLMFNYHLPRKPRTLPRYIPDQDLVSLMQAIHALKCPYQKNALILIRWTGARREEIRRLDVNALDFYTDGTPKLYIPIGKTNTSRWVPIQKEAEIAFKELLEIRKSAGNVKGIPDRKTGKLTDYLFMRRNRIISGVYLFGYSMREACRSAGLLTDERKPKYTSHQFRHTMGTQMANRGASLTTIMKMLGHLSSDMTIRYTYIHDETVKRDYQNTIDKNVVIAGGEYADQLKQQTLREDEVDWIKANFYKTYLTMGHCFHHTREPMCDFADACYFCPKFVTTEEHLSKLIEKYQIELQLIKDAQERGWQKEIDRHTNVAQRVQQIVRDLGGEINAESNQ